MRPVRKLWAVLIVVVLFAGCAGVGRLLQGRDEAKPPPSVTYVAKPPTGTPVKLPAPDQQSGLVAAELWPKACDLVSDADLKAVLPDVTRVERSAGSNIDGSYSFGGGYSQSSFHPVGNTCRFTLELPKPKDNYERKATVELELKAVGTDDVAELNWKPAMGAEQAVKIADADACKFFVEEYTCRKRGVIFALSGHWDNVDTFAGHTNLKYADSQAFYEKGPLKMWTTALVSSLPAAHA
jgi:hypothetical protein